jgi:uncharacterized protein YjaZ
MKCELIFEESTNGSSYLETIKESIDGVVEKINTTDLPEHSVEIRVAQDLNNTILETGSGGWTESPNKIWVYFDETNENFIDNPKEKISSAVAHEFGHAFRELKVPFPGTLLDDLVAEGLADHLDLALVSGEGKPWSHSLTSDEINTLMEKAKPILNRKDHDYFAWFMGSEEKGLPKWGGYSLGFFLVEQYLSKTNQSVIDAIHIPSEHFVPLD